MDLGKFSRDNLKLQQRKELWPPMLLETALPWPRHNKNVNSRDTITEEIKDVRCWYIEQPTGNSRRFPLNTA